MRYRLMASYLGAPYQAAVGPSDRDVTLFAAPPPPEEHGFSPAPGGTWRKQVRLGDIDALWESRPIGSYHGEPCLVLDDLGDRMHIVYLGMDSRRAGQLGYWQVDRGVFEVVVPRHEITDLAEERHEFPLTLLLSTLSRSVPAVPQALGLPPAGGPQQPPGVPQHLAAAHPLPPGQQVPPSPQQVPPSPQQMPPHQAPGVQQLPVRQQFAATRQQFPAPQQQVPAGLQPQPSPQGMNLQSPTLSAPVPQAPVPQAPVPQAPVPQAPVQPVAQQPLTPQPFAQPPTTQQPPAIAAWHGSPTADTNAAWYGYQPSFGNGTPRNGAASGDNGNGQPNGYVNGVPNGNGQVAATPLNGAVPGHFAPAPAFQPAQPPQPADLATAGPVGANLTTVPNPAIAVSPSVSPNQASALPAPAAPSPVITASPLVSQPVPLSPAATPTSTAASAAQPLVAANPGGAVRGRRAARKPRLAMSAVFADLVDMADISRSAYAVDEEVTGAMCLFKTDGGYEVFSCAEDARHEVRFFEDEEAAYFYLFGVLAAEALRNGRLTPNRN
jgi:hypothetical protein